MNNMRSGVRTLRAASLAIFMVLCLSSPGQATPLDVPLDPYPAILAGFINMTYNSTTGAFEAKGWTTTMDTGTGQQTFMNEFVLKANITLPRRIRQEMSALGLAPGLRGEIDYIGIQIQGNGSAEFREFVDLEVSFPGDSATDRREHYKTGLHTATNVNFESFAGCNYVDSAPGNDAVRLRDVWGPNRSKKQGYDNWRPCGTREPSVNRKVRANYEVPFNAVQLLPTVNIGTDTLRVFFGEIRPVVATERQKREHRTDWREWDLWDF